VIAGAQDDEWNNKHEEQSGEDVGESERGVRCECVIEPGHLGWAVARRDRKGNDASNDNSNRNDDGDPEADAEP
jgi:hypothetical protein